MTKKYTTIRIQAEIARSKRSILADDIDLLACYEVFRCVGSKDTDLDVRAVAL